MAATFPTDCEGFYRRDFLRLGVAGLCGLGLPQFLRMEARARAEGTTADHRRTARSIIMVWLGGGPATIDMLDLKPQAPEGIRGQFKPVATKVPGLQVCEHLPRLAKAADQLTVIRSLSHPIPAHGPATLFMTTGNRPTAALQYPSIGSLAARLLPGSPGVPPYVSFGDVRCSAGGPAGYLGTAYNPFLVEGIAAKPNPNPKVKAPAARVRDISLPQGFTLEELQNRDRVRQGFENGFRALEKAGDLVEGLDTFHRQALDILRSDKTRKAFDLDQEPVTLRERYGYTPFGQGALAARRLVEAGVRFVTLSLGGWDTHAKNFEALEKRLLPVLDQTLSALVEDLAQRGELGETMIYCTGEFGRTPKINKNAGRDHWSRTMAAIVAGGPFRRGYVHGGTDGQGMNPASDLCTPDDLGATLVHALGLDPHQELVTPTGRPVQLFREGQVQARLLA